MEIYELDQYISASIREFIEQNFYQQISNRATLLEIAKKNEKFDHIDLKNDIALFSDHGIIHMRDVAIRTVTVIKKSNGILMPYRSSYRLHFMESLGVMLAYLHDIGMVDFTEFGRAIHPQFAAQYVFSSAFDPIIKTLWNENCGNFAWRLENLKRKHIVNRNLHTILREILALSFGHSKKELSVENMRNFKLLREHTQMILSTTLNEQYLNKKSKLSRLIKDPKIDRFSNKKNHDFEKFYKNSTIESFDWLSSTHPEALELIEDIIDTVGALRCADALRQRGTTMKTSAGYQIFLNQQTGDAVFALKEDKKGKIILLEEQVKHAIGEANIAASELTPSGDLRFSFYQGSFGSPEALKKVVEATAYIVNDVQEDVISGFTCPHSKRENQSKSVDDIKILLEGIRENPHFIHLLHEELVRINPNIQEKIQLEPSLQYIEIKERDLYLAAQELDWDLNKKMEVLKKIGATGHNFEKIDPNKAFQSVRQVEIDAGTQLIKAESLPGFCYVPMNHGLVGLPIGGYESFHVLPWSLLGSTSIISGVIRNATITCSKKVKVLIIPREIYLKFWNFTYNTIEFLDKLHEIYDKKEVK